MIQRVTSIVLLLFLILGDISSQSSYEYVYHINGSATSRVLSIGDNNEVNFLSDRLFNNDIINIKKDSIVVKYGSLPMIISNYISDGTRYATKDFFSLDLVYTGLSSSINQNNILKTESRIGCNCGKATEAESVIYFGKGLYGIKNKASRNVILYDTLTDNIKTIEQADGAFMQNNRGESFYINSTSLSKFDTSSMKFILLPKVMVGLDSIAAAKTNLVYHPKSDLYYFYKNGINSSKTYAFSINKDTIRAKEVELPSTVSDLVIEDEKIFWISSDQTSFRLYNSISKKDSLIYKETNPKVSLQKIFRKNNTNYILGRFTDFTFPTIFNAIIQEHKDGEKFIPYRNDISLELLNDNKVELVQYHPSSTAKAALTTITARIKNNSNRPVRKFNIITNFMIDRNFIFDTLIPPFESRDVKISELTFPIFNPQIKRTYRLVGADYILDEDLSNNIRETSFIVNTNDKLFERKITIIPNPSQDFITIETELPISSVKIYDNTGKQVMKTLSGEKIDIATLRSGLYLVSINSEGQSYTKRFIKI
jgi:hypothetical protein